MPKKKAKTKKNKKSKVMPKNIKELEAGRTGGQVALLGFSYQCLYSCYIILKSLDGNTKIRFEGIEDVDVYKIKKNNSSEHIQLKYSQSKQDASFLIDVLKNYLQVHLLDENCSFKMVYDFPVSKGKLEKIVTQPDKMDDKSKEYWKSIINKIKEDNNLWNWSNYNFDSFISKLYFENLSKEKLAEEIEQLLIEKYDITTGNESLFARALKYLCFKKMKERATLTKKDLDCLIQEIKDDINKGTINPAHNWIKRIPFENTYNDLSYYEGKKATPSDIVAKLPVRRLELENEVQQSIEKNKITVIKSSSGQGKTTLALQVAYNLKKKYAIYQLNWCYDAKELNNIVVYFKSRIKLGEMPLILIDNLDNQLKEWNLLAQYLENEIGINYKIILTTREIDWYNYSGEQSNVRSINIINISMLKLDAKNIYNTLKSVNKLDQSITSWESCWEKVSDRKLLIEYVYLLTHGVMISERVAEQIKNISNSADGKVKCDILRKICLADVLGIKISAKQLISSINNTNLDFDTILKSIENEFFIKVDTSKKYIEGLHPVRSKHVMDELHSFVDISDTALELISIVDDVYVSKLFASFPEQINKNEEKFYSNLVDLIWDKYDYHYYLNALRGVFSGSIMKYFKNNKQEFDDANLHGGLQLLTAEINPFTNFEDFGIEIKTLKELQNITPDNPNIQYLNNLSDDMEKISIQQTAAYFFSKYLCKKLKEEEIKDIDTFSEIVYWFINIDKNLNLSYKFDLDKIWETPDNYSIKTLSTIMYCSFSGNKDRFIEFVKEHEDNILYHLKKVTKSMKLYVDDERKNIYVEYILLEEDIKSANKESVDRLNIIGKSLPIYDNYCADAIKPNLDILSELTLPNDDHKTMPLRNIILTFHQKFASLWDKTILSNYEYDSIYEWLESWFNQRKNILTLLKLNIKAICNLLEGKQIGSELSKNIDMLREKIRKLNIQEWQYPHQNRPFEEKPTLPIGLSKIKNKYFIPIDNYCKFMVGLLSKDKESCRLAMCNLNDAKCHLPEMQDYFNKVSETTSLFVSEFKELCHYEAQAIDDLIQYNKYYIENTPSKYFNKIMIKKWNNDKHKNLFQNIKQSLELIEIENQIILPQNFYMDSNLKYLPIIIKNIDFAGNDVLINLLLSITILTDYDFDYIILISCDENNKLNCALNVTMTFLKALLKAYEQDDETLVENELYPLPIDISNKMINCFKDDFELPNTIENCYEGIDQLFEFIWEYSQYSKYLVNDKERDYLNKLQKAQKDKILVYLNKYKCKIPEDSFLKLKKLCKDVFNGKYFGDDELNKYINDLILKVTQ